MKKLYTLCTLLFISNYFNLSAQQVQYTLSCSADGNSYEVFVTRNNTANAGVFIGSSTVTLVLPTGTTRTVTNTNESVAIYNSVTPIIDANGSGDDFYPFNTSGGPSLANVLQANTPVLWLTFTPSDGTDQEARLFINGSDPNNINGVNPSNVFSTLSAAGIVDEYISNTSDASINCATLSVDDSVFISSLELYPNPTSDIVFIKGNTTEIKQIEVYTISGQRVLVKQEGFDKIDVSALQSSIYIIRLYNQSEANKTIRLVKD